MILENIAKSAALYGLRQECTLQNQRVQVLPIGFNVVAAGVMVSELAARYRTQGIPPSKLELSILLAHIGATSDGDDATVNESELFDVLSMALAI